MSESATTPFSKQCEILANVWLQYKGEEDFKDFLTYNDLGLPLAFALSEKIIEETPLLKLYITETWALFLEALGIEEDDDTGFDSLEDLLGLAGK